MEEEMRTENLVEEVTIYGDGVQKLYRFANDYGASVIRSRYSYGGGKGLWELAVTHYEGTTRSLCYMTPITSDVIGYLTEEAVDILLQQIENLKDVDYECKPPSKDF